MAKKRTAKYWEKRAVYLKKRLINRSVEEYERMAEQYEKAAQNIQREIEYWYARFAENNEISLADAKKLLTSQELKELKWDVEEYIEKGRTLNYSKQWAKELENASARAHISRYEALQLQMQQQAEALYGGQLDEIDNMLRDTYQDGYCRTAYEVQKGFGVGWNFAALDERKIEKALARPWGVDGKNFSGRVWENKTKLIGTLNKTLTQSIIRGEAPDKAIKEISRVMEVDKRKAGRLVMTESAFIASESQKDCYKELGVEYFEVLATLDSHTCSDCGVREGQKIPMSEYESGVTAPPFHPYCRCCTVPAFDDEFDIGQRAARGADGKTEYVPGDMSYEKWRESFVKTIEEEKVLFADGKKDDIINIKPVVSYKDYEHAEEALLKDSELWQMNLAEGHSNAINAYTGKAYTDLNTWLRLDKQGDNEELERLVSDIDSGIEGFVLSQDISVLRGTSTGVLEGIGLELDSIVGKTLKDPAYLSSTIAKSIADDFADMAVSKSGGQRIFLQFDIPSGKGRGAYVDSISANSGELEFLIKRNAQFEVYAVEELEGDILLKARWKG